MLREKNELIAQQAFGQLILDYESEEYGVTCRVLIDGWYDGKIYAKDREEAIAAFRAGKWER